MILLFSIVTWNMKVLSGIINLLQPCDKPEPVQRFQENTAAPSKSKWANGCLNLEKKHKLIDEVFMFIALNIYLFVCYGVATANIFPWY